MFFPQFVIYVLIYDYLKFRKDPSITSQEIANYISVALAVALSVHTSYRSLQFRPDRNTDYGVICPLKKHNLNGLLKHNKNTGGGA